MLNEVKYSINIVGTWKMALWGKHLTCKHEDMSSTPWSSMGLKTDFANGHLVSHMHCGTDAPTSVQKYSSRNNFKIIVGFKVSIHKSVFWVYGL